MEHIRFDDHTRELLLIVCTYSHLSLDSFVFPNTAHNYTIASYDISPG